MKSQKIKFDKNKDYIFVECIDISEIEALLGPRKYNAKFFKISDKVSLCFTYTIYNESLSIILLQKEHVEGETITLKFNNTKDMQDYIKANYEITED